MAKYRAQLPQLGTDLFLTDGGLETTLIFHEGVDLPEFAAFVLLDDPAGVERLREYFRRYLRIGIAAGAGFVAEAATWRANPDWAAKLGYDSGRLAAANRRAVEMLVELRDEYEAAAGAPFVISGAIGPRGDAYSPDKLLEPDDAATYHSEQIVTFAAETEADLVTAFTMTHAGEAVGIARAAAGAGIPSVIGFTVETDGRLPSGQALGSAIEEVDAATGSAPAYYMVNCAHPTHFDSVLEEAAPWTKRVRAVRANASRMSHAELDEAPELDAGDPEEFGALNAGLRARLGQVSVLGGCCGTDDRHIAAISRSCIR